MFLRKGSYTAYSICLYVLCAILFVRFDLGSGESIAGEGYLSGVCPPNSLINCPTVDPSFNFTKMDQVKNKKLIRECSSRNSTTNSTSIYSSGNCKEPFGVILKPKQVSEIYKGKTYKVFFESAWLGNTTDKSRVDYIFGTCNLTFVIDPSNKPDETVIWDAFYSRHADAVYNDVNFPSNTFGLSEGGMSSTAHGGNICSRTCKPIEDDGSIVFMQVVQYGDPELVLTFKSDGSDSQGLYDSNGVNIDYVPLVAPEMDKVPINVGTFAHPAGEPTQPPTTTTTEAPSKAWTYWVIGGVVGASVLIVVILGIVGFVFWKKSMASKAAALAAAQAQSTMGGTTATTAGSAYGSTMNDQVNVKIEN